MTDFRTLCAELVDCLEKANWPLRHKTLFEICLADARAALAQPEPPSLKEQALTDLDEIGSHYIGPGTAERIKTIRRALEQLDD
jgi:hypothetical protein